MLAVIDGIGEAKSRERIAYQLARMRINEGEVDAALDLANRIKEPFKLAGTLGQIGFVSHHHGLGASVSARQLFNRALTIARDLPESKKRDQFVSIFAPLAVAAGATEQALKSVSIIDDNFLRVVAFVNISIAVAAAGDGEKGLAVLSRADAVVRALEEEDREQIHPAFIGIKSAFYDVLGQTKRASAMRVEAFGAIPKVLEKENQGKIQHLIAITYAQAGLAKTAIEIVTRHADEKIISGTFKWMRKYYASTGDIEGALAVAAAIAHAKRSYYEASLGVLSHAFARTGRITREVRYLDAALGIAALIEAPHRRVDDVADVAEAMFEFGDKVRARKLLEQALSLTEQIEDSKNLAGVLQELAETQIKMEQPAAARDTLRRGLTAVRALKDDRKREGKLSLYAGTLAEAGDLASAAQLVKEANDPARRADILLELVEVMSRPKS